MPQQDASVVAEPVGENVVDGLQLSQRLDLSSFDYPDSTQAQWIRPKQSLK
jgi:hypothetical protein